MCIILLFHVLYHYRKLFCKTDKVNQNKSGYILVIIYIILSFCTISGFACLRSNMFTLLPISSFTTFQATISYFWIFIFFGNSYVLLWIIFIHRIRIIFNGSAYAYKPYIFRILYFSIIFGDFLWCIACGIDYQQVLKWKLFVFDNIDTNPIQFYVLTRDYAEKDKFSPAILIAICVYSTFINIILLYMFTRSLWKLNKYFMTNYLEEHGSLSKPNKMHHVSTESPVSMSQSALKLDVLKDSNTVRSDTDVDIDINRKEMKHMIRVSMDNVLDAWTRQKTVERERKRPEVQRMVDLHNLIKKQTILVCIALCSDLLYVATIFYEPIEWMTGWFYCLNVICVWMMLATSKRYWIFCKQFGLCCCCYRKSNKLNF